MFKKKTKQNYKTYVISDIHSHFDVFKRFLDDINPEDKVYFLGDAVDKGPDGIKVLKFIKDNPNIQMVMGNHELMMLNYLTAENDFYDEMNNDTLDYMTKYMLEHNSKIWLDNNYGWSTLEDFKKLQKDEQKEILQFLYDLPLVLRIDVNNKNFILVHSVPYKIPEYTPGAILYNENPLVAETFVWEREPNTFIDNSIVITGHTITYHYNKRDGEHFKIYKSDYEDEETGEDVPFWYDIDCGLAANMDESCLCALCLDDLSVKYYSLNNNERIDLLKKDDSFKDEYLDKIYDDYENYLSVASIKNEETA